MENKKPKILIVDDDLELKLLYAEIFRNASFEVILANDGVEGLDKASKELPEVIFTGIVMPRMDGFSMIESLRKTVMTSNIPIVISSHMGREEDKARASELGVKDFIIRGTTTPVEVLDRIKALLTVSSDEFVLEIDASSPGALEIAKKLNFQENFKCSACGEKIIIKLKLINPQESLFEARLNCSKCGKKAK